MTGKTSKQITIYQGSEHQHDRSEHRPQDSLMNHFACGSPAVTSPALSWMEPPRMPKNMQKPAFSISLAAVALVMAWRGTQQRTTVLPHLIQIEAILEEGAATSHRTNWNACTRAMKNGHAIDCVNLHAGRKGHQSRERKRKKQTIQVCNQK